MSRDAIEHRITLSVERAAANCASRPRKRGTAHSLRQPVHVATGQRDPPRVITLILGREDVATTYALLPQRKPNRGRQANSLVASPKTKSGHYRAPDALLRFLEGLLADPIGPITALNNTLPRPAGIMRRSA